MRTTKLVFLGLCAIAICVCQATPPATGTVAVHSPNSMPLSRYVIYRHFLTWVTQLDQAAAASGSTDPYKFAEPFGRAHLQHDQLDLLRNEARKLNADLHEKDASAQVIIAKYREQGKLALAQGKPLPPIPPEISWLEREHTAILVQHYAALRSGLGADATAQLDAYLAYEFAPHIKLKRMSPPGQPVPQ